MPACEGIETRYPPPNPRHTAPAKRMPACEGIETFGYRIAPILCAGRQEDARL